MTLIVGAVPALLHVLQAKYVTQYLVCRGPRCLVLLGVTHAIQARGAMRQNPIHRTDQLKVEHSQRGGKVLQQTTGKHVLQRGKWQTQQLLQQVGQQKLLNTIHLQQNK